MNSYKQRMINLIKADIITLNGPKNSMKSMLVFLLVFSIADFRPSEVYLARFWWERSL